MDTTIKMARNDGPSLTCGLCDNCSHITYDKWDGFGGPACNQLNKSLELSTPDDKENLVKQCIYFRSNDPRFLTKGNVDIRTLEVDDIVFHYEMGITLELKVLTKPVEDKEQEGLWVWTVDNGSIGPTKYSHNINYPSYYSNNLNYHKSYHTKVNLK